MAGLWLGWIVLGSALGLMPGGSVAEAGTDDPGLAQALEKARAEGWDDLHILAQCQVERSLLSAEIFGSGIGVWKGSVQFRLPPDQISAQLAAISESGFTRWPTSFGGKRDPKPAPEQPPRVTCRVSLALDGHHKQVVQFKQGDQSAELFALARGIIDACRVPAQSGVRAESLDDGLGKVATGTLDPVTLQVIVNRKAPLSPSEGPGKGWLLRVEGGEATARDHTRGRGYGEPATLPLSDEDLKDLMGVLRKADVVGLPPNLYAELYTDVTVSVLDHRVQVQARRFEGMTAETHGEKQKSFDQLLEALETLRERVLGSRSEGGH